MFKEFFSFIRKTIIQFKILFFVFLGALIIFLITMFIINYKHNFYKSINSCQRCLPRDQVKEKVSGLSVRGDGLIRLDSIPEGYVYTPTGASAEWRQDSSCYCLSSEPDEIFSQSEGVLFIKNLFLFGLSVFFSGAAFLLAAVFLWRHRVQINVFFNKEFLIRTALILGIVLLITLLMKHWFGIPFLGDE